jgi:dethiobiotin synthetase
MAMTEDPVRSLRAPIASLTISKVDIVVVEGCGGWMMIQEYFLCYGDSDLFLQVTHHTAMRPLFKSLSRTFCTGMY